MYICGIKETRNNMKKHTNIRMEEKLHQWIMREAEKNGRSFTNYIEWVMMQHKAAQSSAKLPKQKP